MQVSCVAESAQQEPAAGFPASHASSCRLPLRCLQWELLRYDDPNQELAGTDLQALEGRPAPALTPAAEGEQLQGRHLDRFAPFLSWLHAALFRKHFPVRTSLAMLERKTTAGAAH